MIIKFLTTLWAASSASHLSLKPGMTISTWLRAVNLAFFLDGFFRINAAATGFTCAWVVCGLHGVDKVLPPL